MSNRTDLLREHFADYRKKVDTLYDSVDIEKVSDVLTTIIDTFKNDGTLFICGNGGSAATASHMQVDFTYFVRHFTDYKPRILSLTDHAPIITAIGNDRSFEDIFKDQLRGVMRSGDTVIFISASGNSENLIRGAQYVNENGGISIAWVGFDGGKLLKVCQKALWNENPKGDYGPIEDLHMFYVHMLVNFLGKDDEFRILK